MEVLEQRKLAVQFTICHLRASGIFIINHLFNIDRLIPDYSEDENLEEYAKKNLQGDAFTTYTAFFIHVDNLCFYIQNQEWQSNAELTINRLYDTSRIMSTQMYIYIYII